MQAEGVIQDSEILPRPLGQNCARDKVPVNREFGSRPKCPLDRTASSADAGPSANAVLPFEQAGWHMSTQLIVFTKPHHRFFPPKSSKLNLMDV
jgi:hypothetical protein